jgi:hypothetical protein
MKPRSRDESIRYASRAADVLTVSWLDWYSKQASSEPDRDGNIPRWSDYTLNTYKLWTANFKKLDYTDNEWNARLCDAYSIGLNTPMMHPLNWEEQNSPWIRSAARFLNKEIGPGPELCAAWQSLLVRRSLETEMATEFDKLLEIETRNIVLP